MEQTLSTTKFECKFGQWFFWIPTLASVLNLIIYAGRGFETVGADRLIQWALAILAVLFGSFFAFGIYNRSRWPFLEITDEEIRWGSALRTFLPRSRVALDDLEAIVRSAPRKAQLKLKDGANKELNLSEIRKGERSDAVAAIEEALARRGPGVDVSDSRTS